MNQPDYSLVQNKGNINPKKDMTLSYINTKLLFLTNQRHCIETPYLFTSHTIYHFTIKMCGSLLMYLITLKQLRSETKIELFKDLLQENAPST